MVGVSNQPRSLPSINLLISYAIVIVAACCVYSTIKHPVELFQQSLDNFSLRFTSNYSPRSSSSHNNSYLPASPMPDIEYTPSRDRKDISNYVEVLKNYNESPSGLGEAAGR